VTASAARTAAGHGQEDEHDDVDRSAAVVRVFGANRSPATSVAVCSPARNEAATIGGIVRSARHHADHRPLRPLVMGVVNAARILSPTAPRR